jgi:hypothetical protein
VVRTKPKHKENDMTTIKLHGGSFGIEVMLVRCDLARAESPVQVDYNQGGGWESTQYQCADARHTTAGLVRIGKELAAVALEVPSSEFRCESEEVE